MLDNPTPTVLQQKFCDRERKESNSAIFGILRRNPDKNQCNCEGPFLLGWATIHFWPMLGAVFLPHLETDSQNETNDMFVYKKRLIQTHHVFGNDGKNT